MTNKGLRMDAVLIPVPGQSNVVLVLLNCYSSNRVIPLALLLKKESYGKDIYKRGGVVNLADPKFVSARQLFKWRQRKGIFVTMLSCFRRYTANRGSKLVLLFLLPVAIHFILKLPRLFYVALLFFPSWLYLVMVERRIIFVSNKPLSGVRLAQAHLLFHIFLGEWNTLITNFLGIPD